MLGGGRRQGAVLQKIAVKFFSKADRASWRPEVGERDATGTSLAHEKAAPRHRSRRAMGEK